MLECIKLLIPLLTVSASFKFLVDRSNHDSKLMMVSFIILRVDDSDGRTPLMGGNWKLNPVTLADASNLAGDLVSLTRDSKGIDMVVFPPAPFLTTVALKISGSSIKLGGQNCFHESSGAFTGEASTGMLSDIGASYVLCGHSERRQFFGDTDSIVNKKVKKALQEGMRAVLCIGETKEQYEAGLNQEVCAIQIMNGLQDVSAEDMSRVELAYEPVWAIGTGLVCPKEVAQEIHAFVRSRIARKYGTDVARRVRIQYGGSVKAENIKELMAMPDIDGALVGGASLSADSFAKIVNYQQQQK